MNSDYIIAYGRKIPEGWRQVCPSCELINKGDKPNENMARKSLRALLRKLKTLRNNKKN